MEEQDLFDFAEAYFAFGNHPLADRWAGYSEGARRGALTHALRQFRDAVRGDVDWGEERWRRACAEQALALLVIGRVANNSASGGERDAWELAQQAAGTEADAPVIEMAGPFATAALRAAGWGGHVAVRG